jgi:hypothetical protein
METTLTIRTCEDCQAEWYRIAANESLAYNEKVKAMEEVFCLLRAANPDDEFLDYEPIFYTDHEDFERKRYAIARYDNGKSEQQKADEFRELRQNEKSAGRLYDLFPGRLRR